MGGKNQTSKSVILQILAEEQHHIRAAGGDASAYYTRSMGKGKKKQDNGKKCSHCKHKGHNISKCYTLKQKQEEKASGLNSKSTNASTSSKASGKSSSKSSLTWSSMKVTNMNANSDSDSDKMIQVFVACVALDDEKVERIYKTKAKLCQSNLLHRWLINSSTSCTMCSH